MKLWINPPDSLDPLNEYEGCFMYVPALVSFDYGSRLDESGNYYNPVFSPPKYTHQKRYKTGNFCNKPRYQRKEEFMRCNNEIFC